MWMCRCLCGGGSGSVWWADLGWLPHAPSSPGWGQNISWKSWWVERKMGRSLCNYCPRKKRLNVGEKKVYYQLKIRVGGWETRTKPACWLRMGMGVVVSPWQLLAAAPSCGHISPPLPTGYSPWAASVWGSSVKVAGLQEEVLLCGSLWAAVSGRETRFSLGSSLEAAAFSKARAHLLWPGGLHSCMWRSSMVFSMSCRGQTMCFLQGIPAQVPAASPVTWVLAGMLLALFPSLLGSILSFRLSWRCCVLAAGLSPRVWVHWNQLRPADMPGHSSERSLQPTPPSWYLHLLQWMREPDYVPHCRELVTSGRHHL